MNVQERRGMYVVGYEVVAVSTECSLLSSRRRTKNKQLFACGTRIVIITLAEKRYREWGMERGEREREKLESGRGGLEWEQSLWTEWIERWVSKGMRVGVGEAYIPWARYCSGRWRVYEESVAHANLVLLSWRSRANLSGVFTHFALHGSYFPRVVEYTRSQREKIIK